MNEENKDLVRDKRKKLINDIMMYLSERDPSLYYLPTPNIAQDIKDFIHSGDCELSPENKDLVFNLSQRDIQIILGVHSE